MHHGQFNADATTCLDQFASRALCLRHGTESRVTSTRDAIAQSRALIFKVDALLVTEAHTTAWRWPRWR